MAAIQPISKINKTNKINVNIFEKNVRQRGAKNGEGMFDVIDDDMYRYRLLTVN